MKLKYLIKYIYFILFLLFIKYPFVLLVRHKALTSTAERELWFSFIYLGNIILLTFFIWDTVDIQ